MKESKRLLATLAVVLVLFVPTRAKADFMDAVLTVGIAAGAGAVLGLSTLPFYEDSGAHSNNIWYGAAIGAVVGVGISAFSAVSQPDRLDLEEDYEAANKRDFSLAPTERHKRPKHLSLAPNRHKRPKHLSFAVPKGLVETNTAIATVKAPSLRRTVADAQLGSDAKIWAPVASFQF